MDKSPDAFRTISEVAEVLETPAHVLRFWETRFPQIRPVKRAGGRRYYRPSDLALLAGIRRLLHEEGMTIRGVQKILREQGVRHVAGLTDEASAEEEALISAMSVKPSRRGAEVTKLTPREADAASVDALEAEARRAAQSPGPDDPAAAASGSASGTVIAFPGEPTPGQPTESHGESGPDKAPPAPQPTAKEPPLPAFDPRQSMFPGFEPEAGDDESLFSDAEDAAEAPVQDLAQDLAANSAPDQDEAVSGEHDEAPFAFDIGPEDDLAGETASISAFPLAQPGEATPGEDSPGEAKPEAAPAGDAKDGGTAPAFRPQTLAGRLRALPPGSLSPRSDSLRAVSRRIAALRQRLSEAQKHID